MALIKCPDCGKMFSEYAECCPQCGCPTEDAKADTIYNVSKKETNNGDRSHTSAVRSVSVPKPEHKSEDVSRISESDNIKESEPKPTYDSVQKTSNVVNDDKEAKETEGVPISTEKETEGKNKAWIWVLVIAVLFLIGGVGYFAFDTISNGSNETGIADTTDTTNEFIESVVDEVGNSEDEEKNSHIPAGLTFRTFTKNAEDMGHTYQFRLENEKIAANLKKIGFELVDRKTESRFSDIEEDEYEVTIETYSKTVNGNFTTVKLEEEYAEIHFPNLSDVENFKETVRACGLKETEKGFMDSEDVYWAGTDVIIKGATVTLSYKWE